MINDGGQPLKHVQVGHLLVVHCSWLKVGCCITNCVMLFITLVKIVLRPVSIFNDSAWLDMGSRQLHNYTRELV